MPHNSGPSKRDMFPGHGAGKGDADRSPKWRDNYDEINWGEVRHHPGYDGFFSTGEGRIRKHYGDRRLVVVDVDSTGDSTLVLTSAADHEPCVE